MPILRNPSVVDFATADLLDPQDLNRQFAYCGTSIAAAASRRITSWVMPLQFCRSVATATTQAATQETLTFRFRCPFTCVIERAYLNAHLTCTTELRFVIEDASSNTPQGAQIPHLTTGGAVTDAAIETSDFNPSRVLLVAGTEYEFILQNAGTFSLERYDVTLHMATDRWTPAATDDVPDFELTTPYRDETFPDAVTFLANIAAVQAQSDKFVDADYVAPAPLLWPLYNFDSSASLSREIPRFDSARASSRIVNVFCAVEMATTGGGTITVNIRNEAGTVVGTFSFSVAGVLQASDNQDFNISLSDADSGISVDAAENYSMEIVCSSASPALVTKAVVILWLAR